MRFKLNFQNNVKGLLEGSEPSKCYEHRSKSIFYNHRFHNCKCFFF